MIDLHEALRQLGLLLIAALLGGAIGFERETHGQAAGVRTNILICVGSCLLMILSLHMEEMFRHLNADSTVRLDPGRIASYAIASMGFLGAGAIIKGKGSVRGLTTAAGLWLVTGIGLAVGAGMMFPAVASALISLVVLYGLRRLKPLVSRDIFTILTLRFSANSNALDDVIKIFAEFPEISIQFVNTFQNIEAQTATYRLRLESKELINRNTISKKLFHVNGLEEMSWEEGNVP